MDKNPPVNAGDTGSTTRPGRFHMLQTNEAHTPQLLSLHAALLSHHAALLKPGRPKACALQEKLLQ